MRHLIRLTSCKAIYQYVFVLGLLFLVRCGGSDNQPVAGGLPSDGGVIAIANNPTQLSNSSGANFVFSSQTVDSNYTLMCHLDDAPYTVCESPIEYTLLADGVHSFFINIFDTNMVAIQTETVYTWTIDTTAPEAFSITGVTGGLDVVADALLSDGILATVNWDVSNGSDSYEVTVYSSDGSSVECPTVSQLTNALKYSFDVCSLTIGSSYTLKATARDLAGNTRSATNNDFNFQVSGVATKLKLTGVSETSNEACVSFTVIKQSALSIPVADVAATTVDLTGQGNGGFYSDILCTTAITQVTIAGGSSQSNAIYFKNSVIETLTLSAADNASVLSSDTLALDILNTFTDDSTASNLPAIIDYGVAWGDYNNDAYPDLYLQGQGLYKNNKDGSFTAEALVTAQSRAGHWADYDNDGWIDLALTDGAENVLYQNSLGTSFADIAVSIGYTGTENLGDMAFLDYDNDGFLDIYAPGGNNPFTHMFNNDGMGAFTQLTGLSLGADSASCNGEVAVATDFDWDGDIDLLYRCGNGDRLFLNDGNGGFSNISGSIGTSGNYDGASFGDYDNDGDLDLYIAGSGLNTFYQFDGGTSFSNQTVAAGNIDGGNLDTGSVAFGDYNNDGFLDLFVANNGANKLYMNQGDGSFVDQAASYGITDVGNTLAFMWEDYDLDGDLDLYVGKFYINNTNTNNYLKVYVTGRGIVNFSPKDATGSRIELWDDTESNLLAIREISAGEGYGSQRAKIQHFGLAPSWGGGSGTYVVKVRFTGGSVVTRTGVIPANATLTLGGNSVPQGVQIDE